MSPVSYSRMDGCEDPAWRSVITPYPVISVGGCHPFMTRWSLVECLCRATKVRSRVCDSHCIFSSPPLLTCSCLKEKIKQQRWYGAGNLPVASSCTSIHLPSVHENSQPACNSVKSDSIVNVGFLFSSSEIIFILSEALLRTDLRNRIF